MAKYISPEEYKNHIQHIRPDIQLISEYKNCKTKILVKDKYGICLCCPIVLRRTNKTTIQTAVDKDSYFTEMAKEVHGTSYDYSKVEYIGSNRKVTITCKIHGNFKQTPHSHLEGQGCPKCGRIAFALNMKGRGDGGYNITLAHRHKKRWIKKSAIVYIIKCWDDYESFYKIGITTKKLSCRFKPSNMPYRWEEIRVINTNLFDAVFIENGLHKDHNNFSYIPCKEFVGYTECFSKVFTQTSSYKKGN